MQTALLLEMLADAWPDRAALGRLAAPTSYRKLLARVRRAATGLSQYESGNVVYVGVNSEAVPLTLFAAGLLGRPFAPLNYRLPDEALRRLLAKTAPSVVIVDDDLVSRVSGVAGATLLPRNEFETLASACMSDVLAPPAADAEIAVLLFTSGTTGEPKAAVLRHRHLISYVISTVEFGGADEEEAALVSVPPYHIAGISAVLTGVYAGRRLVYLPAFSAEAWIEMASAERITHAMVVPTMLARVLDLLETRNVAFPHLRQISYGGGRMPISVIERALERLPQVSFVNAYGLTETSSTVTVLGPEDHRTAQASEDLAVKARLASVGRPLPNLEIEIRGSTGEPLATGESGEVWVRGEQVSGEYLDQSRLRHDGWFPTNDGGRLDEGGYLFLEGRLDDVIVRGGENISPGQVEDVLRAHPTVRDVAVLGVPDDEWGERVVALVVAAGETDAETLKAWVRRQLRSTVTPQDILFVPELPYNEMGKLPRPLLRAHFAAPIAKGLDDAGAG